MNADSKMDTNALAENIQRTVERAALRNVRSLADELEREAAAKNRLAKRALLICAIAGTLFGIWLVAGAIDSDRQLDRAQKIELPDRVTLPNKN